MVVPISKLSLLLLLLAPAAALSQSFEVNAAFDPSTYKPLGGRERWQRWWSEDGAGPAIHVQALTTATYLQVIGDPSAWNRNWGGYVRRVGSSYGGNLMENSAHEALAAAMGTDSRYFACGCTGFFRRSGHAIRMTFLTYNRGGHETLDLPQLSAAYGSTMVEATWWPHHYSALVQGVQTGHIEVGLIAAVHLAQEFSPEFKRILHLNKARAQARP
jgi:hypothetical protein